MPAEPSEGKIFELEKKLERSSSLIASILGFNNFFYLIFDSTQRTEDLGLMSRQQSLLNRSK